MSHPLLVRSLTEDRGQPLEIARKGTHLFAIRRAQMLLASTAGHTSSSLAALVGCFDQTDCDTMRAFNRDWPV